jgi:hypothetical protein
MQITSTVETFHEKNNILSIGEPSSSKSEISKHLSVTRNFTAGSFSPWSFSSMEGVGEILFGVIADDRHLSDRTHTSIFIERSTPDQFGWQSSPRFRSASKSCCSRFPVAVLHLEMWRFNCSSVFIWNSARSNSKQVERSLNAIPRHVFLTHGSSVPLVSL